MITGFIVSLLFLLAGYGVFFSGYLYENPQDFGLFAKIGTPTILIGIVLGLVSGSLYEDRRKKLFMIGLFLIYLTHLAFVGFGLATDSTRVLIGPERVIALLNEGSLSFLENGIFTIPPLLLGSILIGSISKPKW